jgi:exopolyphosphatase/guanosine-5'-triphosphate,3'-diphosphate pyrophosphatase
MAKRTAIIDIGSNSARMVVYEKSSRFAFHLLTEVKSRVRIGEGAYKCEGLLQEVPMQRAFDALSDFVSIIKSLKCHKTFCVATSALRDAPNSKDFIRRIQKELNINIKIIDGKKEAYYGALSSINLLKPIDTATTVDIGGGSTELAKIRNGKIVDTFSINIGTVRLKELFFDKKISFAEIEKFIAIEIEKIPLSFSSETLIGIGGTLRSLSKIIMDKIKYPLETVHGFEYEIEPYKNTIKQIASCNILKLKDFGVGKDRYDTMREGCSIFNSIINSFHSTRLITNGTGVREGVYLEDMLRASGGKFPQGFRVSQKSFSDRFITDEKDSINVNQNALKIFDALSYIHQIDPKYKKELAVASKLYSVGRKLSFYQEHFHSFYFIINNLNYGFSHNEKVLVALLVKYHTKKLPSFDDIEAFKIFLPEIEIVNWLSFIISLAKSLNIQLSNEKLSFSYENHTLTIRTKNTLHLAKESIKKLVKPASFAIVIETI